MPLLNPRQEAFCQSFAARRNGAAAARDAGYADDNAANQAARLLKRPDIAARVAELGGDAPSRHAALAEERAAVARELAAQLAPVYQDALVEKDRDGVLQTVELQARVYGLVSGGSTTKPRGPRPASSTDELAQQIDPDTVDRYIDLNKDLFKKMQTLQDAVKRLEHVTARTAQFVDPGNNKRLLHWPLHELYDPREPDDNESLQKPIKAYESL